jgi:hypothetical protein
MQTPGPASSATADFRTEIKQITFGPKHHFFGYIGHVRTIPWNKSGRYILTLQSDFQERMPKVGEAANILVLDTQNNYRAKAVDQTRAWNFQQGTMFYWNPLAPETQFFFNDRDPKTGEVFCVLFDIAKGKNGERVAEFRYSDTPIGNGGVAQHGGYFLGINYARLARLRPVTGYPDTRDWTVGEKHPTTDGIFKVNTKTREKRLLVSFKQLADVIRPSRPDVDSMELFINHTLWSRGDDRIFFFARGEFENRERRLDLPFTMNANGSELRPLAMHIGGHPEWESSHRLIGVKDNRQIVFDIFRQEIVETMGTPEIFPRPGGDVALSPDGRLFANGHGDSGKNYYTIFRRSDGAWTRTPGFDQGRYTGGELRIDPAPAWNRNGSQILAGALANDGTRQIFVITLTRTLR